MKLELNKEHVINLVNIIPFTAVLPLLAIHSENNLNIYIVQWSTANCPPKTCLVPHPETSACPKKVSPICGQISFLYSKLIFFKCPPSESGIDQPSQKKCPPGGDSLQYSTIGGL
jgi:hypothetical protein